MNPFILASLIYFLLCLGVIALVVALFSLFGSRQLVSPFWAKNFIACCRIVTAAAAVYLAPLTTTEPFLIWSVRMGMVTLFVWELAANLADRRSQVTQTQLAKLEKNTHQVRLLLTMLREVIAAKRTVIGSTLSQKSNQRRGSIAWVRTTLNPPQRLQELLANLARLLIIESQSGGRVDAQSFRVCLYVDKNGFMEEVSSWDSARQNVASTQSSTRPESRSHFDLSNTQNPSIIVQAVRERQIKVISDCGKEEKVRRKVGQTFYFSEAQKSYLKSLICYPFNIAHDPKRQRWAVLAVDTNLAAHFPADPSSFLEPCLVEYSRRIELELVYEELLDSAADQGRRPTSS